MARRKSKILTEAEAELMEILWTRKEASVQDVCGALEGRLAYTTVATMLGILEKKGYLRHRIEGRMYIYSPARLKNDERSNVLRHIIHSFFEGSQKKLFAHLIQGSKLSREQLQELREIIDKVEKER